MNSLTTAVSLMITVLLGSTAFVAASSVETKPSHAAVAEGPKAVSQVVFRASDINLRSGPSTRFPVIKVLSDAKGRAATFDGVTGTWIKIIFEGQPYWAHSSLVSK
jgi:uncharacterized protein YraI